MGDDVMPEYGICLDCAAWAPARPDVKPPDPTGFCQRHPAPLITAKFHGCWDFVPRLAVDAFKEPPDDILS